MYIYIYMFRQTDVFAVELWLDLHQTRHNVASHTVSKWNFGF